METKAAGSAGDGALETGKWYTRALKFPSLIGKTATGGKIPGGPYTYTQFGVFAVVLVVGAQVSVVNAEGFALIGRSLIVLGVAYGLTMLAGRLPFGARNPLSMVDGALRAFGAPSTGKIAGRSVRIRRPHRVATRLTITAAIPVMPQSGVGVAAPARRPRRIKSNRPASVPRREVAEVDQLRPTPATTRTNPTPALTGVQRLLASSGASHQED